MKKSKKERKARKRRRRRDRLINAYRSAGSLVIGLVIFFQDQSMIFTYWNPRFGVVSRDPKELLATLRVCHRLHRWMIFGRLVA